LIKQINNAIDGSTVNVCLLTSLRVQFGQTLSEFLIAIAMQARPLAAVANAFEAFSWRYLREAIVMGSVRGRRRSKQR